MKKAHVLRGLVFLLLVNTCQAKEISLPDLQQTYKERAIAIRSVHSNSVAKAFNQYSGAVRIAADRFQATGNLDGYLSVKNEIERISKEKSCPDSDPDGLPDWMIVQRKLYRNACIKADNDRLTGFIALTKFYIDHLQELEKRLVQDKDIEQAVAIRAEFKKINLILANLQSMKSNDNPEPGNSGLAEQDKLEKPLEKDNAVKLVGIWHRNWKDWLYQFYDDGRFETLNKEHYGKWELSGDEVTLRYETGPNHEYARKRIYKMQGDSKFSGYYPGFGQIIYTRTDIKPE